VTFNLDEYTPVSERINLFYEKYPEGSIQTEFLERVDGGWLCQARAYRAPDDMRPSVAHAFEPVPGKTQFTKDSEAMNAETSAWGRALAALGFAAQKGAGIASREEVQARKIPPPENFGFNSLVGEDAPLPAGDGQHLITFGKYKGKFITDPPRSYWEWWLASDHSQKPETREMRQLVEQHLGIVDHADLLEDIPF
jgi:uncharacterized protein (DUF3820 family)